MVVVDVEDDGINSPFVVCLVMNADDEAFYVVARNAVVQ